MFSIDPRKFAALLLFSLGLLIPAVGQDSTNESAKLFQDRLGDFKASGRVNLSNPVDDVLIKNQYGLTSWASRDYLSKEGRRVHIFASTMFSDAAAYAALTEDVLYDTPGAGFRSNGVGTAGFSFNDGKRNHVSFFKGRVRVSLKDDDNSEDLKALEALANVLAQTIDKGEGDIPALVKHLPGWENGDLRASVAVSLPALKVGVPNQPVLDSISFAGGVAAASAHYGASQLVIAEFNTPQLATDNNAKILAKIQELREQGQPAPTAYRRVGNYAVFVFNAPDETAANQLIDQVKYQQVVQWLGENPFSYEKATREFTETTLGVLVAVVKSSGLALLACLAIGGFLGVLLFRTRRSQQRTREAYADSDAMLRLNLDELTPERQDPKLIGPGR